MIILLGIETDSTFNILSSISRLKESIINNCYKLHADSLIDGNNHIIMKIISNRLMSKIRILLRSINIIKEKLLDNEITTTTEDLIDIDSNTNEIDDNIGSIRLIDFLENP